MKRFKFLGIGLGILSTASAQTPKNQPNIVYILADDLGLGEVGCYGQKLIKTPNIDSLAANGMLFTQHYAGSSVSAPSRSCLLTGQHTGHTFIRGNKDSGDIGEGQCPLPSETFTIAKLLKNAGYVTGAFGKWGLGGVDTEGSPANMGFDEFFGYNCQRLAHNYYPYFLYQNKVKVNLDDNDGNKTKQFAPDIIQQHALKFIANNAGGKFFLYLPYILPHAELCSPRDSIFDLYKDVLSNGKPYMGVDSGLTYKQGAYGSSVHPHADFAAMVTRLDTYVGQVVAELRRLGLDKNTLLIFSSDNGPHKEGGADPSYFQSNGNMRGLKRDLYEGGIKVPMIAYWPDRIKAGTKNEDVSAFWDILPTMSEIIGSKQKFTTDGISILPALLGKNNQKQHPYLYWEFHEEGGKVAVRKGNWKGIKLNYDKNPTGKMLLFDLSTDVHEDQDVAAENPKIVAELERAIKKEHNKSAVFNFQWER